MKPLLDFAVSLLVLLPLTFPGAGQAESPAEALAARIPAIAQPLDAQLLLSGSLAVGHRGEIVYRASWGMASYELAAPNGPDTRFCVASVSKPITALAVARLVAEERMGLADPVEMWIPGLPSGEEMTVMQLLNHTAGIPHRVTDPMEQTVPITAEEIVERVKRRPLLFEPGTGSQYSTAGYSVLARIIEIVTEKDYDAAMRALVFTPFGMEATCHVAGTLVLAGRAQCYKRVPGGVENAPLSDLSFLVGGGSLYSTAEDLVRFGMGCLEKEEMPEGTWDVFADQLGWMPAGSARWNGKTNQFGAFLDLHPGQELVVAFAGNIGVAGGAVLRDVVPRIVAGEEVVSPPPFAAEEFTAETAAPFLGTYQRADGIRTTLVLESGALVTGGSLLLQTGEELFFSPTYGCDVTFDRAEDGTATALVYRPVGLAPIVFHRVGD